MLCIYTCTKGYFVIILSIVAFWFPTWSSKRSLLLSIIEVSLSTHRGCGCGSNAPLGIMFRSINSYNAVMIKEKKCSKFWGFRRLYPYLILYSWHTTHPPEGNPGPPWATGTSIRPPALIPYVTCQFQVAGRDCQLWHTGRTVLFLRVNQVHHSKHVYHGRVSTPL